MGDDTTARDALVRSICARSLLLDEHEARAVDRFFMSLERRRDILADLAEYNGPAFLRFANAQGAAQQEHEEYVVGYEPSSSLAPALRVIDGGRED